MLRYYLTRDATKAGCKFEKPRDGDAGYDIYASEAVTLFAGEQKLVPTGLSLELQGDMVGVIKDRSSVAIKRVYTHGGVIDNSYRGEISVIMENRGDKNYHIEPGQRIAQMLIVAYAAPRTELAESLTETVRGKGSFGSTGK